MYNCIRFVIMLLYISIYCIDSLHRSRSRSCHLGRLARSGPLHARTLRLITCLRPFCIFACTSHLHPAFAQFGFRPSCHTLLQCFARRPARSGNTKQQMVKHAAETTTSGDVAIKTKEASNPKPADMVCDFFNQLHTIRGSGILQQRTESSHTA